MRIGLGPDPVTLTAPASGRGMLIAVSRVRVALSGPASVTGRLGASPRKGTLSYPGAGKVPLIEPDLVVATLSIEGLVVATLSNSALAMGMP